MSSVVEVDDANFDSEVLRADTPVLLDFSAEWCGPCKRLWPIVQAIASEYSGRLKVAHLDVDRAQTIAVKYGILSVPTLLIFKSGQVREQLMGFLPKERIVEKIDVVL